MGGASEQGMDSGSDIGGDNPSPSTGKRRKCTPRANEALTSVMESNREKMVLAFTDSEDREDMRHRELIDLETRKHNETMALEKERIAVAKETAAGFIGALNGIGAAMGAIGAAMMRDRP